MGAGVSGDLGVPTWRDLIDHMASELGYDSTEFARLGSNYLTLAEHYRIEHGSIGPLRSWMDTKWNVSDAKLLVSPVHKLIVSLDFPIIYTTNYDRNLENAFRVHKRSISKIVNVRDITRAREGDTQIVKFHGDLEDDSSIVLTETDYYDRLSLESPLDTKLRADALGKSILFIGYSLADINVRLLLHRLSRTWKGSGFGKHRPKSYIFLPRPNPIQNSVLAQWDIEVITGETESPGDGLRIFLEQLYQKISDSHEAD